MTASKKYSTDCSADTITSFHVDLEQLPNFGGTKSTIGLHNSPMSDRADVSKISTAGMMHDLGNLLQVIASANRMIERRIDRQDCDDLGWLVRSSLIAIERAVELRQRMLGLPTPGFGRELTNLEASISAISELIVVAAGPDIDVHFVTCSDVPTVLCDRGEFENTVLNLVLNARDAMRQGGLLTVSLCTQRVGQSEDAAGGVDRIDAFLSVSDTGQGMAPEVVKAAFDAFFTTKVDGHGLGLAMVDAFARSTGGSVLIDSAFGRGTTITLQLPGRSIQTSSLSNNILSNRQTIDA